MLHQGYSSGEAIRRYAGKERKGETAFHWCSEDSQLPGRRTRLALEES